MSNDVDTQTQTWLNEGKNVFLVGRKGANCFVKFVTKPGAPKRTDHERYEMLEDLASAIMERALFYKNRCKETL